MQSIYHFNVNYHRYTPWLSLRASMQNGDVRARHRPLLETSSIYDSLQNVLSGLINRSNQWIGRPLVLFVVSVSSMLQAVRRGGNELQLFCCLRYHVWLRQLLDKNLDLYFPSERSFWGLIFRHYLCLPILYLKLCLFKSISFLEKCNCFYISN